MDYKSCNILTSVSIILLQTKTIPLFTFGLNILSALYDSPEKFENFEMVSQFSIDLWNSSDKEKPLDEVLLCYLFKGLLNKNCCDMTLWAIEIFVRRYSSQVSIRGPVVISFLLVQHVLAISDPNRALNACISIKLMGNFSYLI